MKSLNIALMMFVIVCSYCTDLKVDYEKNIDSTQCCKYYKTIKLPKKSILQFFNIEFKDSCTFFTACQMSNKIFQCHINDTLTVKQVGKKGQGKGEYIDPLLLHYSEGDLFFSDYNRNMIKGFNLTSNKGLRSIHNISNGFIKYQNLLFVKNVLIPKFRMSISNKDNHILSIYDLDKQSKLYKKMINIDMKYQWVLTGISGGITFDKVTNCFYIVNNVPYVIYVLDLDLNLLKPINMEKTHPVGFISSGEYLKPLIKKRHQSNGRGNIKPFTNSFHQVERIYTVYDQERSFLIVSLVKKNNVLYHILNTEGEVLEYFFSDKNKMKLIGVYDNLIYFLNYSKKTNDNDEHYIDVYQFNESKIDNNIRRKQ